MRTERLRSGEYADITAITEEDGSCQVRDFLQRLDVRAQKKVFMLFELYCACGQSKNTEKLGNVSANIWVFRSIGTRIFCFFMPDAGKTTLVLTHAIDCEQSSSDDKEVRKAEEYFRQCRRKG